jgi:cytochrome c5
MYARNLLIMAGVVVGLWSVAVPPLAGQAQGDVARGAKAWADNCERCHNRRDPKEFRDDQWQVIMSHMRAQCLLTGEETRDILAFLQASNNPAPEDFPAAATPVVEADPSHPGLSGRDIYLQTCVACHGEKGTGAVPGAPDFTQLNGRLSKPDEVLVQHITHGFQSPGSPLAMPPKGGNPKLTQDDIRRVLEFLRKQFGRKGA